MTIIVAPATLFQPGTNVTDDVFGDSNGTIANTALAQTFVFTAENATATGDASTIDGTGRGGDDRFTVTGVAGSSNTICGDALTLDGSAQGGDDKIAAAGGLQFVVGDAGADMYGGSQGGNDRIDIGLGGVAIGDGFFMHDLSQGGDDRMTVRAGGWGLGDAGFLYDGSQGGDDRLTGIGKNVILVGDAKDLVDDDTQGGNDWLVARGRDSRIYGDAQETMSGDGGDDYLHNQGANSLLVGDGQAMNDSSAGGNDVLLGGKGNDTLWGDAQGFTLEDERAGDDRFVFGKVSGKDVIHDFQQGHDIIDVQQIGYTGIGQLTITDDGTNSVVHFHGINQVTVLGVTGLNAADFLFA